MSLNRFEEIRRFIHFNNNNFALPKEHENHDGVFKIRPIVDYLNNKFCSIPTNGKGSVN